MKVKNILVPVDYSHSGDAALDYAVTLAQESDAELHLVHVYEQVSTYVDGGFASPPLPVVTPDDLKAEQERLNAVIPENADKVRREFIVGSPADELVDYAKKENIDLIVMGTHGRTGLNRLLMGSVAEGVVRRATCPVLTIKQPEKKLQDAH